MLDKERSDLDKLAAQVAQASTGGGAGGELGITARSALQDCRVCWRPEHLGCLSFPEVLVEMNPSALFVLFVCLFLCLFSGVIIIHAM